MLTLKPIYQLSPITLCFHYDWSFILCDCCQCHLCSEILFSDDQWKRFRNLNLLNLEVIWRQTLTSLFKSCFKDSSRRPHRSFIPLRNSHLCIIWRTYVGHENRLYSVEGRAYNFTISLRGALKDRCFSLSTIIFLHFVLHVCNY